MKSDFAIGLPNKEIRHELPTVDKPRVFEFTIHDHKAERRGRHFDLRLGDPETGQAHSWAMSPRWPKPGEQTWAISQPTHRLSYMDWEGTIGHGYGKGKVSIFDRNQAEVPKASPGHISFHLYRGSGPEEYTLHRVSSNNWILYNRTLNRAKVPGLPDYKPKYKEVKPAKVEKLLGDSRYVASAKIDDAHSLFLFRPDDKVRAISYRLGKKSSTGIIEHTHKVPALEGVRTPSGLGGTILRGGLYALDPKTGEAASAEQIAGMLNSDVWKSREKQKEHGELLPVLYDVVRYKGKDMEKAPYADKLKVLREVEKKLPDVFHLPRMAFSKEHKEKLMADIGAGKIPETTEGVVLWNLKESEPAIKSKFVDDHDVYVRDFFPGEGKYKGRGVGGFLYSHEAKGPIVGRVGTGLSDEQRLDMFKNPDQYKGMVARVTAQTKYKKTQALRAPAFQNWHLDKNEPLDLSKAKQAALDPALLFFWGDAD